MLKKQILLAHDLEGRKRRQQQQQQLSLEQQSAGDAENEALQSEREREAASALVNAAHQSVSPHTDFEPVVARKTSQTRKRQIAIDDDEDDDAEADSSSDAEWDGAVLTTHPQTTDDDVPYHVIRSLLSHPHYAHLSRTASRPKLRCGMRDCRRHTSYYCVKCTRKLELQFLACSSQSAGKRPKVYALCSPIVENNLYCFYRHAMELPERSLAEVDQLKALDANKPKRTQHHFPPPKEKRFRKDSAAVTGAHLSTVTAADHSSPSGEEDSEVINNDGPLSGIFSEIVG